MSQIPMDSTVCSAPRFTTRVSNEESTLWTFSGSGTVAIVNNALNAHDGTHYAELSSPKAGNHPLMFIANSGGTAIVCARRSWRFHYLWRVGLSRLGRWIGALGNGDDGCQQV